MHLSYSVPDGMIVSCNPLLPIYRPAGTAWRGSYKVTQYLQNRIPLSLRIRVNWSAHNYKALSKMKSQQQIVYHRSFVLCSEKQILLYGLHHKLIPPLSYKSGARKGTADIIYLSGRDH